MRIAHISPFLEQVSSESQDPQGRTIFHLTKHLTRLGHDVRVFASGDSRTACELVPVAPLARKRARGPGGRGDQGAPWWDGEGIFERTK